MKFNIEVPINVSKVLRRLKRFGYQAYLVGGCVRDAMIGQAPKDWDVATDATPDQIKEVFDNSRAVGRRFPIVHVYFHGCQFIEVATFRSGEEAYGTMTDDVYRRDYTVNALYWDAGEIIDPFTGAADIKSMTVVCIGKPDVRFTEDPVRMLRAVRLMQLGFTLSDDVESSIKRNQAMLGTVNKSRLYCEFVKAVQCGSIKDLMELELLIQFFPRCMYDDEAVLPEEGGIAAIICAIVWTYYCDLVGGCIHEFNLHPIPASQKAAKLLVEQLRQHMDVDRQTALEVKSELHIRYRNAECT